MGVDPWGMGIVSDLCAGLDGFVVDIGFGLADWGSYLQSPGKGFHSVSSLVTFRRWMMGVCWDRTRGCGHVRAWVCIWGRVSGALREGLVAVSLSDMKESK